jgi:hypothetical protein
VVVGSSTIWDKFSKDMELPEGKNGWGKMGYRRVILGNQFCGGRIGAMNE